MKHQQFIESTAFPNPCPEIGATASTSHRAPKLFTGCRQAAALIVLAFGLNAPLLEAQTGSLAGTTDYAVRAGGEEVVTLPL